MATYVTTQPATSITAYSAVLNGTMHSEYGDEYAKFEWGLRSVGFTDESDPEPEFDEFSLYIDGLGPGTEYQFRAVYDWGSGEAPGNTRFFNTSAVPTDDFDASGAGSLGLSGNVTQQYTRTQKNYFRYPVGVLTPTGAVAPIYVDEPGVFVRAVGGTITPAGAIERRLGIDYPKAEDGTLGLAGAVSIVHVAAAQAFDRAVAGALSFSGNLPNIQHFVYVPTEGTLVAGIRDIYIEQGATYARTHIWKDADGDAIDLSNYTLRGKIRPYKGSSTLITDLTVTATAVTGVFIVALTASQTTALSFIRGFYDVEAVLAGAVSRLIEGNVFLSEEVTT